MRNVFNDVGSAVGWTPLVRINRVGRDTGATFYAKLEFVNPGSSIKDRIARRKKHAPRARASTRQKIASLR